MPTHRLTYSAGGLVVAGSLALACSDDASSGGDTTSSNPETWQFIAQF